MSKESQIYTHTRIALVAVHKHIHEGHISSDLSIAYVI